MFFKVDKFPSIFISFFNNQQLNDSFTIKEIDALIDDKEPLKSPNEATPNSTQPLEPSDRLLPLVKSIKRLHSKENEAYNDFLGSFEKPFEPHFKTQFYTEPVPIFSENQLNKLEEEGCFLIF